MKTFELDGRLRYKRLSKGFRKVFDNIVALSTRSSVTIMDEPIQGMDFEVRKQFFDILLNDFIEYPRLFFISSHIISEMQNLLEEVLLLNGGRLMCHMPVEEMQQYAVFINGRKDIVQRFIESKKVLYVEDFGNSTVAGVVNDLSDKEVGFLNTSGAVISKMNLDDVCINLLKADSKRMVGADE
jgi:ABC-2 type transport system ATP-binding protein